MTCYIPPVPKSHRFGPHLRSLRQSKIVRPKPNSKQVRFVDGLHHVLPREGIMGVSQRTAFRFGGWIHRGLRFEAIFGLHCGPFCWSELLTACGGRAEAAERPAPDTPAIGRQRPCRERAGFPAPRSIFSPFSPTARRHCSRRTTTRCVRLLPLRDNTAARHGLAGRSLGRNLCR